MFRPVWGFIFCCLSVIDLLIDPDLCIIFTKISSEFSNGRSFGHQEILTSPIPAIVKVPKPVRQTAFWAPSERRARKHGAGALALFRRGTCADGSRPEQQTTLQQAQWRLSLAAHEAICQRPGNEDGTPDHTGGRHAFAASILAGDDELTRGIGDGG